MTDVCTLIISAKDHESFLAISGDTNPTHRRSGGRALVQGVHTLLRVIDLLISREGRRRRLTAFKAEFLLPIYTDTIYSVAFSGNSVIVGTRRTKNVRLDFINPRKSVHGETSPEEKDWIGCQQEHFPKRGRDLLSLMFAHLSANPNGKDLIDLCCIVTNRIGNSLPAGRNSVLYSLSVADEQDSVSAPCSKFKERGAVIELRAALRRLKCSALSSRGEKTEIPMEPPRALSAVSDSEFRSVRGLGEPRVLLLGGFGQIGRRVSQRLSERGVSHVTMGRLVGEKVGRDRTIIQHRYLRGDLSSVAKALSEYHGIEVIFYGISPKILPARDFGLDSVKLRDFLSVYLLEVTELFKLCEIHRISRLVVPGSSFQDDDEYSRVLSPYFTYVTAKKYGEQYLRSIADGSDVEVHFPRLPPVGHADFAAALDRLAGIVDLDENCDG